MRRRLLGKLRDRRARALALLALTAAALVPAAGCASAAAREVEDSSPRGPARPARGAEGVEVHQADTQAESAPTPVTLPAEPLPADEDDPTTGLRRGDLYADRAQGTAGPEPMADGRVRLVLPGSSALDPLPVERRPALPARSSLALVSALDARLFHDEPALLALGRALDGDPEVARVMRLGDVAADQVDLRALARLARERHHDLLLVDVRRNGGEERAGLLVHAASGAVLGRFEVRGDALVPTTGRARDDLVERVGLAYARLE